VKIARVICAVLLLVSPLPSATPQENKPDKKQLEAQAKEREAQVKQFVADGKALEKQDKLVEAREKYVDAEGIMTSGDALGGIHRIDDKQKQQVESLLEQAQHAYQAGKCSDSIEQLKKGLTIQPANAAIHYDLALCYAKMGDRANSAVELDQAIGSLPNQRQRTQLLEWRSTSVMGTPAPAPAADPKKNLFTFNLSYLQEDRDPSEPREDEKSGAAAARTLCDQTRDLSAAFPANPAVVFNSAKCAAEDAKPEDAARQLAAYIQSAPDALDRGEAQAQQESLTSLASLKGDSGQAVRQHYATAARYIDYRHYDRAVAEYEAAEKAQPDYAQTEWMLGIFYEAYGDVAKARQHLQLYQQLEPDAARKSEAGNHLSTLDNRHDVYEANVEEAADILTELLVHAMGIDTEGVKHKAKLAHGAKKHASSRYQKTAQATDKLSTLYVQRELESARADAEAAAEIFPLGPEANELLALMEMQGNNWPAAYRSYDAVASQSYPVSFYAQVNSAHDSRVVRAAKVEIASDAVRLVYLTSYDTKKQISTAPETPAGDDDLGNLVVSSEQPPDAEAESLTIRPGDLKGISTDKNFVELKLQKDQIYLAPLDLLADAPFQGGAARTFGNEYTRMFIRYLGYEDARLGKEGMTAGEKFKLGFDIAQVGMTIGMSVATMGAGAPGAYSSAIQAVQIIHALNVFSAVNTGLTLAGQTKHVVDTMRSDLTSLERATSDQERVIGGMEFKVVPSQPVAFTFRNKF
jgi:tetratricopeptide (TPR) repeat protein